MSNSKSVLIRNASSTLGQTVLTAGLYFVLYGYLIRELGAPLFGIWSIVLAATSATAVANLGVASSMVKFIAMYQARENPVRVVSVILTGSTAVAIVLAVALAATYPLWRFVLGMLIKDPPLLTAALSILPYTIVSFWLSSLANVFSSSLDGCHRVDLRNLVVVTSTITFGILGIVLSTSNGLIGLAYAQIIQGVVALIMGWLFLRKLLPTLPVLPFGGKWDTFREIFSYSASFQLIGIMQLLFEPLTKALVLHFAGPTQLSYFEFARRLVVQLKSLIVNAHQSIVPYLSKLTELNRSHLRVAHAKAFDIVFFLAVMLWSLTALLIPSISRLWIGEFQPFFVFTANLLLLAWFVNVLSGPSYFTFVGEGTLKYVVASHVFTGLISAFAGVLLGSLFGPEGVVIGVSFGIAIGSAITIVAHLKLHGESIGDLFSRSNVILLAAAGVTISIGFAAIRFLPITSIFASIGLMTAIYLAIMTWPALRHPAAKEFRSWTRQF